MLFSIPIHQYQVCWSSWCNEHLTRHPSLCLVPRWLLGWIGNEQGFYYCQRWCDPHRLTTYSRERICPRTPGNPHQSTARVSHLGRVQSLLRLMVLWFYRQLQYLKKETIVCKQFDRQNGLHIYFASQRNVRYGDGVTRVWMDLKSDRPHYFFELVLIPYFRCHQRKLLNPQRLGLSYYFICTPGWRYS